MTAAGRRDVGMGGNGEGLRHLNKGEREVVRSFVRELREKLGDELVSVRLFGSKARGDFHADSDIDLFVLVREKTPEVKGRVRDLAADYVIDRDTPISVSLCDLLEAEKGRSLGSLFPESIEREGIPL